MIKKILVMSLFPFAAFGAPCTSINGCTNANNPNSAHLYFDQDVSFSSSATSSLDNNSTNKGARPLPRLTQVEIDAIVSPALNLQVFNLDKNIEQYFDGAEWQDRLTAQHVTGSGAVTVTNDGMGHVNIFGAGSVAPDAAYAAFSTQNNSAATTFPGINTFKPVYLGISFSADKTTDFTNQFLTIDSVSTPVMTYTGATTQEFDVHESFSIRGAVATTATFKFCIAVRLANGTVNVTNYCQLATASNLIDFIPGPKLVGSVELATGDSVFAEVQNITNTNSIYAAFSNYLSSSVAGSIPDTNGLPQGTNNRYLSTDGGVTLASKTGSVMNGHLAQFSGTSGLVSDAGIGLNQLDLQYIYDHGTGYPFSELTLASGGDFIIYGSSGIALDASYTDGLYTEMGIQANIPQGYFRVGSSSIDPNSTSFSVQNYVSGPYFGSLPYPGLTSAQEAAINTAAAPNGLSVYNTDTKTLDLWDGTAFRKFLSSNQFSGDFIVNTSGMATIANGTITYAKFQQIAANSLVGNPTGSLASGQGITLGSTLAFSGTALQTNALTGDVTSSANSFATTIANSAVTNAKIANTTIDLTTKSIGVAAGQVLSSNGVGVSPVWSASPTLSGLTLNNGGALIPSTTAILNFDTAALSQLDGNYIKLGNTGRNIGLSGAAAALPLFLTANLDFDAQANSYKYNSSTTATLIELRNGSGLLRYAPSGTAGAVATLSDSLTWDTSGNINIPGLTASSLVATTAGKNLTSSVSSLSPTFTGLNLSGLMASLAVFTDGSKNLTSSGTVGVTQGGTGLSSTTANQILYSSASNTIAGLATANNGILATNGSGVPSIGSTLPDAVLGNIPKPTVIIYTSGSGTYTPTAGTTHIHIEMWGPGGGSGGIAGSASAAGGSGGGGGGGHCVKDLASPSAMAYVVGAGGNGGSSGANNGAAGTATTLGSYTANSGAGGNGVTANINPVFAQGGAGGTATGCDLNAQGSNGGVGFSVSSTTAVPGVGGSSPGGGGSVGVPLVSAAGNAGYLPGGGAGGARSTNGSSFAGNDGANGRIVITEFSNG